MKKKLTVLALAFAMVLTMSASVFAAGQNSSADHPSSAAGDAKLVKYAQIPEGVTFNDTLNNTTFTFTFTPHAPTNTTYGVPVQLDSTKAGYWGPVTKTIKVSDMTKAAGNSTYGSTADTDTENRVGTLTIASIFSGYTFPRAGEFMFKVVETGSATDWTYSKDEYLVRLVVDNSGAIDDVTVQDVTTGTDGTETPGDKVNPEDVKPGDNGDDGNSATTDPTPTPADSLGGFTFTNLYKPTVNKHDEPRNPNPDDDPDTPSNPDDIVKDRFERLLEVVQEEASAMCKRGEGRILEVLAEEKDDHMEGWLSGRLSNNMLVHFEGPENLIGKIVRVKLTESKGFYYIGTLCPDEITGGIVQ